MDQRIRAVLRSAKKRKQIDSLLENHLYYLIFPRNPNVQSSIDISFVALKQQVYRLHKEPSFNFLAHTCKSKPNALLHPIENG